MFSREITIFNGKLCIKNVMLLNEDKTDLIIKCFYKVYNKLGYGFLEKVYENALIIELRKEGMNCLQQTPVKVYYDEAEIGLYFSDIIVDNEVILELKAGEGEIIREHESQLQNYLRATEYEVGIILHFGKKPSFKRKIYT
ncbi:MAG: GxxExxY protein [Ferruginibacter sp.]